MNTLITKKTKDGLGAVALPQPMEQLASKSWDVIIIGAGHNGLTCAAYLARAGKRVLVLEARERVGGACTLEEPWPGYTVSPCAYLAGLMHPLVIKELEFHRRGFEWFPAEAGLFVPFEDGSCLQLWEDDAKCEAEIKRFAPGDVNGWNALNDLIADTRTALRHHPDGDMWLGTAPTREQIEDRVQRKPEAVKLLFEWSMNELLEHYLDDERLHMAMLGQGVIGTNASPFDPGTASIHFHHSIGTMEGRDGLWGYVKGGMGVISFILCDVAREAGAVVATHMPVAKILPRQGVELADGKKLVAPIVVSNADPHTTLKLLGDHADSAWKAQVEALPQEGCTLKVNVAMRELPNFTAKPGLSEPHHFSQVNTPLTKAEWQAGYEAAKSGNLPEKLWTELYFQTSHDRSIAPPGMEVMSVFSQYVPHEFAEGNWDIRREEAGRLAIDAIAAHCSNLPGVIEHLEVLGPPDIEEKVGLAGGHIFQGECLPDYMWDKRLAHRTPMAGVFLCGACTHPGGSVIAANGRNAAMEILNNSN